MGTMAQFLCGYMYKHDIVVSYGHESDRLLINENNLYFTVLAHLVGMSS